MGTRGRPKKEVTASHQVKIRMTDKELEQLHEVIADTGMSQTEVIKKGIELQSKGKKEE